MPWEQKDLFCPYCAVKSTDISYDYCGVNPQGPKV